MWRETRIDESRRLVFGALMQAYGSYVEQEGKKADQWRDQTMQQHIDHITHEWDEVRGNLKRGEIGFLRHNLYDLASLAAIIIAYIDTQELEALNDHR